MRFPHPNLDGKATPFINKQNLPPPSSSANLRISAPMNGLLSPGQTKRCRWRISETAIFKPAFLKQT
jgi:hypothetical protein